MQTYKTTLTNKTSFEGDVDLFHFVLDPPQQLLFIPGQYIILTIPQSPSPVKRLYSIASSPSQPSSFELLIKRVPGGIASNYIGNLAVGDKLEVLGPAGLFSLKNTPHNKVFLTTGTGIAPIRSFILSNPSHTQHYYLFWGMPSFRELYLLDELRGMAQKDPFLHVSICLSREQSLDSIPIELRPLFSLGHIDNVVSRLISSQPQNSLEYYICGRREVVESTRDYLYNQNIDRSLVHFERY